MNDTITSIHQLHARLQAEHPTFAKAIQAPPVEPENDSATFRKFSKELFMERAQQREARAQVLRELAAEDQRMGI